MKRGTSSPKTVSQRLHAWGVRTLPTRESIEKIGWLRPIAHVILRSDLWRFHRRSVPRGVAIGLVVGIFLMIPGLQVIGAILVSLPFRANIPLAVGMTFLSNPLTTPFILLGSIGIGNALFGLHADVSTLGRLHQNHAHVSQYFQWLMSDAAPALIGGLGVISSLVAIVGYFAAIFVWRWWIAHKWRHRWAHRIEDHADGD